MTANPMTLITFLYGNPIEVIGANCERTGAITSKTNRLSIPASHKEMVAAFFTPLVDKFLPEFRNHLDVRILKQVNMTGYFKDTFAVVSVRFTDFDSLGHTHFSRSKAICKIRSIISPYV